MLKKLLAVLMIMMIAVLSVGCVPELPNGGNSSDDGKTSGLPFEDSGELQFIKSSYKFTQEQVNSQIKAEYLLENNGYKDSDEVVAILSVDGSAIIDDCIDNDTSVAEYVSTFGGQAKLNNIEEKQNAVIKRLKASGLITDVVYKYSTLVNAVAVKTTYGKLDDMEGCNGVVSVSLSDTYNQPKTMSADASTIRNAVEIYDTGIYNPGNVPFTGEGTSVAVLDSGFDVSHTVFTEPLKTLPEETLMLKQDYIASVLGKTQAIGYTKDLKIYDVYVNNKIPFVYDYADKDKDVYPYDSEHGTHVAGIIGGEDDVITGVAKYTQLVLMKVFPDLDSGGRTEDILAALEDAVLIGVDAINMSLGSSCGFTRAGKDEDYINTVYDKIDEAGISLITAASNSYNSGYGGEQGNTNMVTNPDSATVGSPSTYNAALSVASISGTMSQYMLVNDSQIIFFNESNALTGKENHFFDELYKSQNWTSSSSHTINYVTVPGVGSSANYTGLNVKGKVALVRRGTNTFEEKAAAAKKAGAIACIIYNNIDGDILMSMGKSDHIPTISISKSDGTKMASVAEGTIVISHSNQAGPFMSDFSSWGPTPSLELKPEITAHGGNIKSSVPGGGYDELSGTSMATPNLCGVVILIRQYLKEKFPTYSHKQISVMCNQMLMSTATIAVNEQGNPYSPRKQGAGLASISAVSKTKAYLTVDGKEKTKIELKDDPKRTGVYTLKFNVVNVSDTPISYNLGIIGMTETVSEADEKHIAERDQLLNDNYTATATGDGSLSGKTVTVNANGTLSVTMTYKLTDAEKSMIDSLFPYGMYVEGFVTLKPVNDGEVALNAPFLAFYGDWTEAPMFDKTYYEVESEKHDASIDDDDKIKADYYATTPYGSYFYNYIIPLGTYLYDIDTNAYDAIPASEDHIAISDTLGSIDGIAAVHAGLLRNARQMTFTITDKQTGETVYEHVDYSANKAYPNGASPIPYYEYLKIKSSESGFINNRQYEFKMSGLLDYGDGGVDTNVRNTFSFDFYLDNQAPTLESVSYEKIYDRSLKKDRYYINMDVYDNQYVMAISPIIFTSSSSYSLLLDKPIPVYGEKGAVTRVRFEITDFLDDLYDDALITSGLAFSIEDYALNSNIYICQLPGTRGDFKFTKDGETDGEKCNVISIYEDEILDLTQYLATADKYVDEGKDYLKFLQWTSSNENIAVVKEGQVVGVSAGRVTITVTEQMDLKKATVMINVKKRPASQTASENDTDDDVKISLMSKNDVDDIKTESLKSARFSYFDTKFAYSRGAQTSQIGKTGDRIFVNQYGGAIACYPGEQITLAYDVEPWYVADNYTVTYKSSRPNIAKIDDDGRTIVALAKGSTIITAEFTNKETGKVSNIMAKLSLTVNSEFVLENRMLVAYKGLGGTVTIPDDEGILYIGAYAFCLYTTDRTIEVDEDDYDKNKIPATNTSVTKIIIPNGVEEIQKYAFYNCVDLREVVMPDTVKYVREFSFYNDAKLTTITTTGTQNNVLTVGGQAFEGCVSLEEYPFTNAYALGVKAFNGCTSLAYADLRKIRNSGERAFQGCTSLTEVSMNKDTKLSEYMFANSGLTEVSVYPLVGIPQYCFAGSKNLTTVNIYNGKDGVTGLDGKAIEYIGLGAFYQCNGLSTVNLYGNVNLISDYAFYQCTSLTEFTLPDNAFSFGSGVFQGASSLSVIHVPANAVITATGGGVFEGTALTTFDVATGNSVYSASSDGHLLVKGGDTIVLASIANDYGEYVVDATYTKIADGAFGGTNVTKITFMAENLEIGDYAFAMCKNLTTIDFSHITNLKIGVGAFRQDTTIETVTGLENADVIGNYAFANSSITEVTLKDGVTAGEGAFFSSNVNTVTLLGDANLGFGAFQSCVLLETVNMPETPSDIKFGACCFSGDVRLAMIDLSKTTTEKIERETFFGCTTLSIANLANIKEIGEYAFANASGLKTVLIPVAETIKDGAFSRYGDNTTAPTFVSITLPETLKTLGDAVFAYCQGLLSVEIPASLTNIGGYTFAFCTGLERVTLHESFKVIPTYTFASCSKLANINLGNVEEIGSYAFTDDEALATVDLTGVKKIGFGAFASTLLTCEITANNLTEIGNYAFQNVGISKATMPKLQVIGEGAFNKCIYLTEFVFGSDLKSIGSFAFNDCINLAEYYFLKNGQKVNDGVINDYATLIDGVLYTKLKNGKTQLTSVPQNKNVKELNVAEGTSRIDYYAGNKNAYVQKIILPDSMRIIGNYAFYGYTSLKTVEFRSAVAPSLEDFYNKDASLTETDPGYELLHNQFDLFKLELYYYTFIDLVGKRTPITMVLPANEELQGYDSTVFKAYFGYVSDATRSDYVAQEKNMIDFIDYANKVLEIKKVAMTDEKLINNALSAYNAVTQDHKNYGITDDEWNAMVSAVTTAKSELMALKLKNASKVVQTLQQEINALPDAYTTDLNATLDNLTLRINDLQPAEREILDLTKYTNLVDAREKYESGGEEKPDKKKGCKGSVSALSAIALVITAVTATVVLCNKKEG